MHQTVLMSKQPLLHNDDECADFAPTSLRRKSVVWGTSSTEQMGII